MRLKRLWIKDFKNLKDFSIEFSPEHSTSVLIGRNGTGKSNLFEAIVLIFKNLDLNRKPAFGYKIEYSIRSYDIIITADPNAKPHSTLIVNGTQKPFANLTNSPKRMHLPVNIFSYYSGPSNKLEAQFDDHQKIFYKALLDGNDKALRPLFYARMIHSNFVLLSFFSFFDKPAKNFLNNYLGVNSLESILFVLKKPEWFKDKKPNWDGDERFWYARGVVRDFLDELYNLALAPIYHDERVQLDFRKTEVERRLYLYIKDKKALKELSKKYKNHRDFFKVLESTYISDLIREVRIRVKLKGKNQELTFKELSEGEQQLLTVLGLLRFMKNKESLFLLDEPDTHLNPLWKLHYLNLLDEVVGDQKTSQVIMCTHDPLVIGGLEKEQVRILDRQDGQIKSLTPNHDPKGMGVAALLTSEIFGLETTLDLKTQEKLNRRRILYIKSQKKKLSKKESDDMRLLSEELGSLDFTKTTTDPLYNKFVMAVMQREEFKKPTLTAKDRKKQNKIAQEILDELLLEEKS